MGLDMYLTGSHVCTRDGTNRQTAELGYWRKHPNLHGYIVRELAAGIDNCQPVPLEASHIRQIMEAIQGQQLPVTIGFFFGASDGSETEDDLAIFSDALEWLETPQSDATRTVTYQASW
jgi:hypothetical protein